MKPEQQRIAIAEACGWKKMNWNEATVYGSPTHGFRVWKSKHQDSIMSYKGRVGERIPDYLNDLNAMHEAEQVLTKEQQREYVRALYQLTKSDFENHCATAAQRAEAFLRTLNLWKSE